MANKVLSELGRRLPSVVLGFMAAKQGGPQAFAAFQQGLQEAQQAQEARQRQAQLDDERQQLQAAQEARMQSADARAASAEERAGEDQRLQRLNAAINLLTQRGVSLSETSFDPDAAQQQLTSQATGLEQTLGMDPGQLTPVIPQIAPAISARKKRVAKDLYEQAEKLYGAEAIASDSITIQTEAFGAVKPSQLRDLFGAQAVTADGMPAPIATKKPDVPNTPEEQFYATFAAEHNTTWEQLPRGLKAAARKEWMQADDRPPVGATVVIHTVDAQGNPVTKIVPKTAGAEFTAPQTGTQRQQTSENTAVLAGLTRLRELTAAPGSLAAWVGPVRGRTNTAKLVTPGIDVDPQMAEFFAEVAAIKNRMIRAITGAQMSEPEARRIMAQLPDVNQKPGVFVARMAATERNLEALNAAMAAKGTTAPGAAGAVGGREYYDENGNPVKR